MAEKSTYNTIPKESHGLYKEKGSKFLGFVRSCYSADEAKEILTSWKKEHHQARHLCYAYRFGVNGDVFRANDDGEPSNSAGAPILGQLQSYDLTNIVAGVVRYYGGTKLGVGGLINAYRTATKDAIEEGEIIQLEVFNWVVIKFEYSDMPSVMNLMKKFQLEKIESTFEISCEIKTHLNINTSSLIKEEFLKLETCTIRDLGIY